MKIRIWRIIIAPTIECLARDVALEFLIARLPEPEKKDDAVQAFVEMKAQIDEIKRTADTARFDRVLSWLEDLSQRDEKTFTKRLARINALAKK